MVAVHSPPRCAMIDRAELHAADADAAVVHLAFTSGRIWFCQILDVDVARSRLFFAAAQVRPLVERVAHRGVDVDRLCLERRRVASARRSSSRSRARRSRGSARAGCPAPLDRRFGDDDAALRCSPPRPAPARCRSAPSCRSRRASGCPSATARDSASDSCCAFRLSIAYERSQYAFLTARSRLP